MKKITLPLAAFSLLLSGCTGVNPPKQNAAVAAKPGCDQKTASGLGYRMLAEGKGDAPGERDKVTLNYKGTLAADGTVFDANDGASFGVDGVIPGFGEGLQLVKPGGSIRLCIPAALGYGAQASGKIPANSDLVFDVDLISVSPAPPQILPVEARSCKEKTASDLGYDVLKAGEGGSPTNDHVVLIGYAGYLASDGQLFDQNDHAPLAVQGVVAGFSEGLKLMNKGGKYRLCIPSKLGYGAKATGPIPANSDLVFLVDLIDMKSQAELKAMQAARGGN
jgi:FKBP-type peptidyl-prolyl cis-trans isomerase